MAAIGPDSVALIPAAREVSRNSDMAYPFRQDSDFYYLTGFDEPNAILALAPGHQNGDTTILVQARDKVREQWTGVRLGSERAGQVLGIDQAFNIEDADTVLPSLLENRHTLHATLGEKDWFDTRVHIWLAQLRRTRKEAPVNFCRLSETLHELRLIKSDDELKMMQRASDISVTAHKHAMEVCRPGLFEYHLEAELVHIFMQAGARFTAYPCIIAGGNNSCVMHYVDNRSPLRDGELVLIDAGCEYNLYAADITRTFPINGKFSPRQRDLYELVLKAQTAAIATVKPGASFREPHDVSTRVLAEGLINLGILKETINTVMERALHRKYTVHSCSHWLGLDVHDVGAQRKDGDWRILQPGMVMTIEPGLYIQDDGTAEVDEAWRGIGIRIEDDVAVTSEGCKVLSEAAPKTVADIEAWMHA